MYRSNIEHPSQTAQQRQLQQLHQLIYIPKALKDKMNLNSMPNLIEINNSFQFPTRFLSNELASSSNDNSNTNNNNNKNNDDSSILGRCSTNKTENQYNLLFHKSTISKRHIQFKYDSINKKWYIKDLNTKHGSILSHSFKFYANDLSSRENSNTYFELFDGDIIGLIKSSKSTINQSAPVSTASTHSINNMNSHTQPQQVHSTTSNHSTTSVHSYETSSSSSSSSGTSPNILSTSTYKFKFFDYRVFKDTKFQILVSIRDNGLQLSVINIAPRFEEYTRNYVNSVKNNNNNYLSLNQKKSHQNILEESNEQEQHQQQQQQQSQTSISKKTLTAAQQQQEDPSTPLRNNSSRSKSNRTHETDDYDELLNSCVSRHIDFNSTSSFSSPSSNSTSKSLISSILTDIPSPRIVLPVKANKRTVELKQLPESVNSPISQNDSEFQKSNSSVDLLDSQNSAIPVKSIKSVKSIESIQSLTTEKSDISRSSISAESAKSTPSSISSDYFDDDVIVKAFDSFNSSINLMNSVNQLNNPIIGISMVKEIKPLSSEIPHLDSPISLFEKNNFSIDLSKRLTMGFDIETQQHNLSKYDQNFDEYDKYENENEDNLNKNLTKNVFFFDLELSKNPNFFFWKGLLSCSLLTFFAYCLIRFLLNKAIGTEVF
ncbi:hypothetical protein B5S32_g1543 [[Candida] boidinii]|nr:hypothetical protein B5S32_g1543 [[Candida] boidinii]